METPIELGLERRAIRYAAIRPNRRKTRALLEQALLVGALAIVAFVFARDLGLGLATLFAGVAASL